MPEVKDAPPGMFCPFMSGAPLAVQTSPLARADGAMAPKRDASKLTPCIESKCRAWHHARKDCKITLAADAQLVAPQLIHQGFSELLGMIASLAEAMGYQRIVPPAEANEAQDIQAAVNGCSLGVAHDGRLGDCRQHLPDHAKREKGPVQ